MIFTSCIRTMNFNFSVFISASFSTYYTFFHMIYGQQRLLLHFVISTYPYLNSIVRELDRDRFQSLILEIDMTAKNSFSFKPRIDPKQTKLSAQMIRSFIL